MTVTLQSFWNSLGKLRCSIGLILFQAELYHTVTDVAARSDAALVDFSDIARVMIPEGARYVNFKPSTLFEALIRARDSGSSRKVIVQNFDLAVARMKKADRNRLWEGLIDNYPANSDITVALAMPNAQTAGDLLPSTETLRLWTESKRVFNIAPV
jgi:hypothetical protein